MDELLSSLPLAGTGLLAVTLIDSVGAMASRRLQFNYGYLTVLSLAVYIFLGYYGAEITSNKIVAATSLLVGTYDATVGLKLSRICNAYLGSLEEEAGKITYGFSLLVMVFIAPLFSGIGYAFATNNF